MQHAVLTDRKDSIASV